MKLRRCKLLKKPNLDCWPSDLIFRGPESELLAKKIREEYGYFQDNVYLYTIDTAYAFDTGLWETAIIDDEGIYIVQQYKNKKEAEKGHKKWLKKVLEIEPDKIKYLDIFKDYKKEENSLRKERKLMEKELRKNITIIPVKKFISLSDDGVEYEYELLIKGLLSLRFLKDTKSVEKLIFKYDKKEIYLFIKTDNLDEAIKEFFSKRYKIRKEGEKYLLIRRY